MLQNFNLGRGLCWIAPKVTISGGVLITYSFICIKLYNNTVLKSNFLIVHQPGEQAFKFANLSDLRN